MKRFSKSIDKFILDVFLIFWLAGVGQLLIPASAVGEKSVADEVISLNVTDKPLGEVLENISEAAGCQFSIDASWEDYPITASFKNEPLYRVIKRILRDFNNAVIYGSDRKIKIIIYQEGGPGGKKGGYSVAINPAEAAVPLAQPYSDATAPQAEVPVAEDSSSGQNIDQPSEATTESDSEAKQADAESTESQGVESSEGSAEDRTAALTPEPKEGAPEQQSSQTETGSASDNSENSEKTGNDEESSQN